MSFDQMVIGLIEPASQAHERLIDAGLVPEPTTVFDVTDLVADIAAVNADAYHERLNRVLNAALRRAERRESAMWADPRIDSVRLKRQAVNGLTRLYVEATYCASHFEFHP